MLQTGRSSYVSAFVVSARYLTMIKNILQKLCLTIDVIVMLAGKAASFLVPALALVVAFEVFSRYALNQPTIWAYDLSLFMFGYIAALGGAWAHQQRAHINVDIFYLQVSPKTRSIFNLVSFSLAIFFLLLMANMCFGKFEEAIEFDFRRQSEWAPQTFHFWLMLVIASLLFVAQLLRDCLTELWFLTTSTQLMTQKEDSCDGN